MKVKLVWQICLALSISLTHLSSFALEMKASKAKKISIVDDKITLYRQESNWFGMTCQSSSVGSISGIKSLSVGDMVALKEESFKIGVISVNEILESVKVLGKTLSAKGDIVCLAASDSGKLPSVEGCQGLWLHIADCQVDES